MSEITDTFQINLNQNIWGLLVAYGSLGFSEYYGLCTLFWFSVIAASVMTLSICLTTFSYTKNYMKRK